MTGQPLVLPLDDATADRPLAGGKGASLARLSRAGLPVPGGFHVTTAAYRDFVTRHGLRERILSAAADADPDTAARRIAALFDDHEMPARTAEAIRATYAALRAGRGGIAPGDAGGDGGGHGGAGSGNGATGFSPGGGSTGPGSGGSGTGDSGTGDSGTDGGDVPVAVRSSATAEDLPEMSFAGQQDTYLNIRGAADLLGAVKRCWASLWTPRAIAYRARTGVPHDDVALAVVVQELVRADAAGILFTADPMTGAHDRTVINAAWGLGEAVVGGLVTPDTLVIDAATGAVIEERLGDKGVRTVRTADGTREEPVPAELRRQPAIDHAMAARLADLGTAIERLYGTAMDVEWAVRNDRPYVVQARPITAMASVGAGDAAPAEHPEAAPAEDSGAAPADGADGCGDAARTDDGWNDSRYGEYLWTNANLGEAIPDVMTPCTWSMVRLFIDEAMSAFAIPGYPMVGNIGGRLYMNLSVPITLATAVGATARLGAIEQVFGRIPAGVDVPRLPLTRWRAIRLVVPLSVRTLRRVRADTKRLPAYLPTAARRSDALRDRARSAPDPGTLAALWEDELRPWFAETSHMLRAAGRQGDSDLLMVRDRLIRMVGEADAGAMLTGVTTGDAGDRLASLGPVIGLGELARGEIDHDTYARRYGHRGPHEFELRTPRPGEDPGWIDRQLAARPAATDGDDLLARQGRAREAAWARFRARYPRQEAAMRRKVARWGSIVHDREATRSEVVRAVWAIRAFVQRAGELTGHGDDLFFLSLDEIAALLRARSAGRAATAGTAMTAATGGVVTGDATADVTGGADASGDAEDAGVAATARDRRATYERYAALPPYPTVIVGHFDPVAWAADPARRTDLYDARGSVPAGETVTGFPGSPGVVEGIARVLSGPDEGDRLGPGEILVTTVTNVGWTPMFARAAAVVTDIGAPLSHAAIVARELGIPAVVGTGNATMRLRDGDRIRVDGERGAVEALGRPATEGRAAADATP
jgi:rifampicin phosphotransferase